MDIVYHNLYEITELQQKIMRYVDYWVHVEKTPVPQKCIIIEMETKGDKESTVCKALGGLLKSGYIRKAITNGAGEDGIGSEKTKYVQLRRI
jgi:hypothetical protein